jgi:hypothetical protein
MLPLKTAMPHVPGMDNFKIVPTGSGFQVVQELPDGRESFQDDFATADDASDWLVDLLTLLGIIDCMSGKASRG